MVASRRIPLVVAATALAVSACSAAAPTSSGPSPTSTNPTLSATPSESVAPSAPPPGDGVGRTYDIGGFSLSLGCRGTGGSPTVIVEAGLGNSGGEWGQVALPVSSTTRMCYYDRAGIGNSDADPSKTPPTAASMARELGKLLGAAHIPGPYVVVSHSFGGIVGRMFIAQNPTTVRGAVFVDSSTLDQLLSPAYNGVYGNDWTESGRKINIPATEKELAKAGGLGSRPEIVLTQDADPDLAKTWFPFQNKLARLSSNSVHVIALGSGHGIHIDKPDIVVKAIEEVVTAVQTGKRLPSCASTFASAGGRCLSG